MSAPRMPITVAPVGRSLFLLLSLTMARGLRLRSRFRIIGVGAASFEPIDLITDVLPDINSPVKFCRLHSASSCDQFPQ